MGCRCCKFPTLTCVDHHWNNSGSVETFLDLKGDIDAHIFCRCWKTAEAFPMPRLIFYPLFFEFSLQPIISSVQAWMLVFNISQLSSTLVSSVRALNRFCNVSMNPSVLVWFGFLNSVQTCSGGMEKGLQISKWSQKRGGSCRRTSFITPEQ